MHRIFSAATLLQLKSGAKVRRTLRIKTVNYRGSLERFFIVREGLNSSFVENFRYTIGGKVKLIGKDEIDVKHRKRVVFVELIKTHLDAHVSFGAISRFLVHDCDILFKYHKDTTIFRFRFTFGHKKIRGARCVSDCQADDAIVL